MKTNELTGAALDWAVAKCEGATNLRYDTVATWWVDLNGEPRALSAGWSSRQSWHPSTNWSQGGPIIERCAIAIARVKAIKSWHWTAGLAIPSKSPSYGDTPLIAAMRCFVASKLGDEVEIPEELK